MNVCINLIFCLSVILVILVSGCVQQLGERGQEFLAPSSEEEMPLIAFPHLGSLCSGEGDCVSFCSNNRGICEEYCREHHENELCVMLFSPEDLRETEIVEEFETEDKTCEGNKTKFDFAPVDLIDTKIFLPLGLMAGNHVTPIDHHYFQNFDNEGYDIEVYSPGKGFITEIQHMPSGKNGEDYRVVIEHTCTISSIFIHLGTFAQKFKEYAPDNGYVGVRIPVEAGELIGYYEKNVDYNLVDTDVVLDGFLTPELYATEPWKIHVPDTYEYFDEPIRSELVKKSLRTVEPISGKIDYDIDGRLVGNWFIEGTNGYANGARERYWAGHLAIVYDAYDPKRIVFSIGNYKGEESQQFGVTRNAPDPAAIDIQSGLVVYELVAYDWITAQGIPWDRKSLVKGLVTSSNEIVLGVVLVQMLENRKIKFEAFPEKTASQVTGFTANAKIYER